VRGNHRAGKNVSELPKSSPAASEFQAWGERSSRSLRLASRRTHLAGQVERLVKKREHWGQIYTFLHCVVVVNQNHKRGASTHKSPPSPPAKHRNAAGRGRREKWRGARCRRRSHDSIPPARSCVTREMVAPSACNSCSNAITASPFIESKFSVGSSARRMEGLPLMPAPLARVAVVKAVPDS